MALSKSVDVEKRYGRSRGFGALNRFYSLHVQTLASLHRQEAPGSMKQVERIYFISPKTPWKRLTKAVVARRPLQVWECSLRT